MQMFWRFLSSHDDGPDATVSVDIGIIGILLFSLVLGVSIYAFSIAINKFSKNMFLYISIYCILELPRYIYLVEEEAYRNRVAYAFHLEALVFFFAAFSFACYLLHDAVDLSRLSPSLRSTDWRNRHYDYYFVTILFDRRSLVAANILYQCLTVFAISDCVISNTLSEFFKTSIAYKILTYVEAVKNLIYGSSLLYYSRTVRKKLLAMVNDMSSEASTANTMALQTLNRSLRRLIWVMVCCFGSFIIRFLMLLMKAFVVEHSQSDPFYWMPPYGLLWWTLADFIPRCVPAICFFLFLGNPHRNQRQISTVIDLDDDKIITTMSPLVTEGIYMSEEEQHRHHKQLQQQQVDEGEGGYESDEEDDRLRQMAPDGFTRSFPMPIPQKKQQNVLQQDDATYTFLAWSNGSNCSSEQSRDADASEGGTVNNFIVNFTRRFSSN